MYLNLPPAVYLDRPILMIPTPGLPQTGQQSYRPKQRIFRLPAPLLNVSTPDQPPQHPAAEHQPQPPSAEYLEQPNRDAVSSETITAAAGRTSSRLLKHITNPPFNPPKKN
ncbi:hypothetical protein PIB30_039158 [Stylosanthes scabra]|uniref:Uncharacterized protein n=1 Tax=Stylosanthes scabra TaxID=79078 RepID=A0ABU6VFP0_9FABA|nr:hypothetical protein [Stylosanthes scabra]